MVHRIVIIQFQQIQDIVGTCKIQIGPFIIALYELSPTDSMPRNKYNKTNNLICLFFFNVDSNFQATVI